MSLTIGSLFSGIGGLELGLEWAGLGPVAWQVERDPFCRAVLEKHWPAVERHADVTTVRGLPHVDLVCGGFPCQDVSSAGRGAGLQGARSGLWWYFAAIIDAVRPRFVVVENVASGARRWLPTVRRHLYLLGYDSTAYALSAADVGAPHLRRRIFVVAHAHRDRELAFPVDAEVAGASCAPADPERRLVRVEQGKRRGARRARETVAADDGQTRVASDTHAAGREGTGAVAHEGWIRSAAGAWGPPFGGLVPLVHGLSGGMAGRQRRERIRALGNAVVPQCAEVIGRVVAEMAVGS